ncbi:sodium-dependent transporter [Sphingomicrobium astaxanthinifaciens]|uniref:sodium-dependent transporter n=1 Tax=Sphingomicrobium astaxanthinifaciens TaxID=1227949 RepID=UPI001FCC783E|nr:sodium-dependent transporter [Sphingomicrobium astaxanthinifaciens]MCJ7420968.1 sodium-dependent transporter [Sphingomicrobium astaxanthinifaciens]
MVSKGAAMGSASAKEGWSSRGAFILAAVGAAVGLGNIWRFPALAGESGGGAFVLVYIAFVALLGLPLVLAEITIGRIGQTDAVGSIKEVAKRSQASGGWSAFGGIGAIAAFLILSFYSVVAGWVLYYASVMGGELVAAIGRGDPLGGAFAGESVDQIQSRMGDLFGNPWLLLGMHAGFMGVTWFIVSRGVHAGIEKAATYLMPAFFVLLIGITIYGAFEGNFSEATAFLFTADFSKLTPQVINAALGQALFSLSLGVAGLITYGSYIRRSGGLGGTSATIALADTMVAMVAGLMIFPIVFAAGLDPAGGPTLVFQALPVAFQAMPGGALIGFLFFLLIFVAALTSSISLLEVPTAYGKGEMRWTRFVSASIFALGAFILGIASLLGYNVWAGVSPLGFWSIFEGLDILDTIDGFTGRVMLPLGVMLLSIFIGWKADAKMLQASTGLSNTTFRLWRFLVAWVCPIAVGLVLLFGLFPGLLG